MESEPGRDHLCPISSSITVDLHFSPPDASRSGAGRHASDPVCLRPHGILSGSLLPELLGEPDEHSFGTPDVAEPIHLFILGHFADERRAAFAEPDERIVDVFHGEHDA